MKLFLTNLLALLLSAYTASAQLVQAQIIHNAPEPTVDIYVNGLKVLEDFSFRSATPFVNLPAGIPLEVAVAPENSTSSMDAIATFPLTLENGKTYAVTASGIVGSADTPFTLLADDGALQASAEPDKVSLNILHGSPDAPAVDVTVRTGGTLVANLAYGESTPYLNVDPGVYYLDVKPAGTNDIVQTFRADLAGLAGQALRVFASGLLNGTPGFGLFAALTDGNVVALPAAPVARVQVIHNSPSPTVDVWANDDLLIDNFEYRTATPFIFVDAEVDITLGIALDTSTSSGSSIATFPVNLENGKTYIVTASGVVGDMTTPFTLNINDGGRETAQDTNFVDVAVLHGSTNAPAVDVDAVFVADNVISNIAYGDFTPYLGLSPEPYDLAVRATGDPNVVASFRADLSGLKGGAAYVFASGLLGEVPAFGLFAALPDGNVVELPLTPTARLQVIHNSPSPTVDVYAGNTLVVDDFAFRTATPFIDVPADRTIALGIAPETSSSSADAIATFDVAFEAGRTYAVMATGEVGSTTTPFILVPDADAREAASDPAKVDFNVQHGSIDAPGVDIAVAGLGTIISDLAYPDFTPYFSVDPNAYLVQVKPAGSPVVLATFRADLSGLTGGAARVFASGLLNGTPAFGLFAALPDGTVLELPVVPPPPTTRVQIIHNSPSPTVDIYADDELLVDDFDYRTATPFLDVPADVLINIGIAPGTSTSVNDVIATFPVTFDSGSTYVVTASGIVGDMDAPFTLIVNDNGREAAADPNNVDIAVLHGATDAPAVDIDAIFVANDLITALPYGEYTFYYGFIPDVYDFAVRAAGDPNVVASFRADLTGLAGSAAYVFASGFLTSTPAFGLFAALPDGSVLELPLTPTAQVQVIHNSPDPTVDIYAGNTLLLDNFAFRTATPFVDIPADRDIQLGIAPENSTSADDAVATQSINLNPGQLYAIMAIGELGGNPATPFVTLLDENAQATAPTGKVAVSVLHGSPDAPVVDVVERIDGALVTDLAYGEFTGYIELDAADNYYLDVKPAGVDLIVATYRADLAALSGQAIRVFASGYLGNDPGFGLFAALPDGTVIELPFSPVARVQVVHNSPDPTVDVYINNFLALNNFEYLEATGFGYLPAGIPLTLGVAPDNSASSGDAFFTADVTLENGKTYIVVASGLAGDPTTPFTLLVNDMGRERAQDQTRLEFAILHGVPNAPAVDLVDYVSGATVVADLAYGEFLPYLSLDPGLLLLDVVPSAGPNTIVGTWGADLSSLPGLVGLVMATGLLNDDPEIDLVLVLPNGLVLPLAVLTRAQVIHNSPSPVVDIYLDDDLILDDFEFREATNIGLFPARAAFDISVAPANSSSSADAIYTLPVGGLETGRTYILIAAGVVGSATTPFQVYVNENGRDRALNSAEVDLALFHGSPDAPEVDVQVPGGPVLFDNLSFGEFSDYQSVPPGEYILELTPGNDNSTVLQAYRADISSLTGQAATVFASGFLGNTPGFEVWVALTDGTTFPLPVFVSTNELDGKLQSLQLAPNPASEETWVQFELLETEALRYGIRDVAGRLIAEGDYGLVPQGIFRDRIDVSQLTPGLYQLELYSDQGRQVRKFAVHRP